MRRGLITGYVFKLARESIPASQERLAEELGQSVSTIQGWETGRRSLAAIKFGDTVAMRNTLARLGSSHTLLDLLDEAAEADFLMGAIAKSRLSGGQHPLGHVVMTHRMADLIGWAITGTTPAALALPAPAPRHGPVPSAPTLHTGERVAFFAGLHTIADQTRGDRPAEILAHRQACFLSGLDPAGESVDWLAQLRRSPYFTGSAEWTPRWVDSRSVATALARQGDLEPLRAFIAHAHDDPDSTLATLAYSAYWAGEVPGRQRSDNFMVDRRLPWQGTGLLRHLTDRLAPGRFVDLSVHTTWLLLSVRRQVLQDDPATASQLYQRTEQLLDGADISQQSRTELTSIRYLVKSEERLQL